MMNKLPLQFPLLVCAPMVEQSELPFRMLCRKYGTNLAYTPMLHSKMMLTQKKYKADHFTTCQEDRPLVAQLCGNDPETMVQAAKMLENQVDAIDINLGCPQGIARRGHYGSFLLEEPELVGKLVKALVENIKVPIFCKIRIRKTEQKTFEIVNKIVESGCSLLTVHGRTKEQNKEKVGSCDWKIIKKIKESINIPVVANGGIHTFQDAEQCIKQTGVDGVMSAEALLENPALFSGEVHCLDTIAEQYMGMVDKYPGASISCIRGHLFKILYKGLSENIDLREQMTKVHTIPEFKAIVTELKSRRENKSLIDKFGWYTRHWKKHKEEEKMQQNKPEQQVIKHQDKKEEKQKNQLEIQEEKKQKQEINT